MHLLARRTGLIESIDRQLLKAHWPHYKSDHVLHIGYNILTGGT